MRICLSIIAFASVAATAGWASGETQQRGVTLDDALAFEDEGQLVEALDAFRAVLRTEGNSREALSTIYLHLAMLQQASGDREGARDAMYRLLAVNPEPDLPVSAPPALAELLEEAQRLWRGRRLSADLTAPETLSEGEDGVVRVEVHDDVPGMVAAAVLMSGSTVVDRQEGSSPYELTVPSSLIASGEADGLEVRLLDEHGGTLWQSERLAVAQAGGSGEEESPPDERPPPPEPAGGRRSPLWAVGWALLGTGVALGVAGGALVGVDETWTGDQRVVQAGLEEERLDTDLGGWVLVGIGGAALVTGIVLVVLGRRGRSNTGALTRIGRGGGLGLEL